MKRILIAALCTLLHASASAGSASGAIRDYTLGTNGMLYFSLESEHTGRPACAHGQWGQWVLPLTGPDGANGKLLYAAFLAAFESGRVITVNGKGNCDVWGDRETVDHFYVVRR